jgi:hypothetical protein
MQDESRRLDRGQYVAHVDLGVHAHEGGRGARARAASEVRRHPILERVVLRRRELVEVHPLGPVALELLDLSVPVLGLGCPRIVRAPEPLREDAVEDECGRSLRVGRREEHAHQTALGEAEDGRAFTVDRVEHGSHVVHPLLERRQAIRRNGVGETGAALVEQDQPGEAREALEDVGVRRLVPHQVDVRDPARYVDQVERPFAHDLVGDVQVATLRVASLRTS